MKKMPYLTILIVGVLSFLSPVLSQGSGSAMGLELGSGFSSGIDSGSGLSGSGFGSGFASGSEDDSVGMELSSTTIVQSIQPSAITTTVKFFELTTTIAEQSILMEPSSTMIVESTVQPAATTVESLSPSPTPSNKGNFLMPFPSISELYLSSTKALSSAPSVSSSDLNSSGNSEMLPLLAATSSGVNVLAMSRSFLFTSSPLQTTSNLLATEQTTFTASNDVFSTSDIMFILELTISTMPPISIASAISSQSFTLSPMATFQTASNLLMQSTSQPITSAFFANAMSTSEAVFLPEPTVAITPTPSVTIGQTNSQLASSGTLVSLEVTESLLGFSSLSQQTTLLPSMMTIQNIQSTVPLLFTPLMPTFTSSQLSSQLLTITLSPHALTLSTPLQSATLFSTNTPSQTQAPSSSLMPIDVSTSLDMFEIIPTESVPLPFISSSIPMTSSSPVLSVSTIALSDLFAVNSTQVLLLPEVTSSVTTASSPLFVPLSPSSSITPTIPIVSTPTSVLTSNAIQPSSFSNLITSSTPLLGTSAISSIEFLFSTPQALLVPETSATTSIPAATNLIISTSFPSAQTPVFTSSTSSSIQPTSTLISSPDPLATTPSFPMDISSSLSLTTSESSFLPFTSLDISMASSSPVLSITVSTQELLLPEIPTISSIQATTSLITTASMQPTIPMMTPVTTTLNLLRQPTISLDLSITSVSTLPSPFTTMLSSSLSMTSRLLSSSLTFSSSMASSIASSTSAQFPLSSSIRTLTVSSMPTTSSLGEESVSSQVALRTTSSTTRSTPAIPPQLSLFVPISSFTSSSLQISTFTNQIGSTLVASTLISLSSSTLISTATSEVASLPLQISTSTSQISSFSSTLVASTPISLSSSMLIITSSPATSELTSSPLQISTSTNQIGSSSSTLVASTPISLSSSTLISATTSEVASLSPQIFTSTSQISSSSSTLVASTPISLSSSTLISTATSEVASSSLQISTFINQIGSSSSTLVASTPVSLSSSTLISTATSEVASSFLQISTSTSQISSSSSTLVVSTPISLSSSMLIITSSPATSELTSSSLQISTSTSSSLVASTISLSSSTLIITPSSATSEVTSSARTPVSSLMPSSTIVSSSSSISASIFTSSLIRSSSMIIETSSIASQFTTTLITSNQLQTFIPLTPTMSSMATSAAQASIMSGTPIPTMAMTCPTLLAPGVMVQNSSLVIIEVAVTSAERQALLQPGGLCELEDALTQAFITGRPGGNSKRQATQFDADIIDIGALANGAVHLTFFVASRANGAAIPATTVVDAFAVSNPQQIGPHPVTMAAISVMDAATTTAATTAPTVPVGIEAIIIPLIAAIGGAIILLLILILVFFCCFTVWNSTKNNKIAAQILERGNRTFQPTDDFESYHRPRQSRETAVTLSKLARQGSKSSSELAQTGENTTQDQTRASHDLNEQPRNKPGPSGNRSHFVEPVTHYSSPPQGMKLRHHHTVVPTLSTGSSQRSLTPTALKTTPDIASRAAEARQLREEALRLQEEREEDELRARRKATLRRMLASERKRRKARVTPLTDESQDTYLHHSRRRKRHWIHRQSNRIAPNQIKHGRSHRGRPLHQDGLPISGRASRSVAEQATQELAWLNTGNGVQLMSIQPLAPPLALQPTPLSSLPAVNPLHSVRLQQRQLDAYLKIHQDMERLHLDGSIPPTTTTPPRPVSSQQPVTPSGTLRPPTVASVAWHPQPQYTPVVLTPAALSPTPAIPYPSIHRAPNQVGQLVWSPLQAANTQSLMVTPEQLSLARQLLQTGFHDNSHMTSTPAPWTDPFHLTVDQ